MQRVNGQWPEFCIRAMTLTHEVSLLQRSTCKRRANSDTRGSVFGVLTLRVTAPALLCTDADCRSLRRQFVASGLLGFLPTSVLRRAHRPPRRPTRGSFYPPTPVFWPLGPIQKFSRQTFLFLWGQTTLSRPFFACFHYSPGPRKRRSEGPPRARSARPCARFTINIPMPQSTP
jgi:hypothetical protein